MTQMIDVTLPGPSPWGFRLAGGKDFNTPIHISKTTPNGKAAYEGLQLRDVVCAINGRITSSLTHFEAQDLITQAHGDLHLKIRRGGSWVQSPTHSNQGMDFPSAPPPTRRAPEPEVLPPPGSATVVHKQFNSPVGLYSADNIADAFKGQVEGMGIDAGATSMPAAPMSPMSPGFGGPPGGGFGAPRGGGFGGSGGGYGSPGGGYGSPGGGFGGSGGHSGGFGSPGGSTPFGAPPGSYEVLHSRPRPMAQTYSQHAPVAQNYAPPRARPPMRPQPQQHRPPPVRKAGPPQKAFSNPGSKSRSFRMLEEMTQEEEARAYDEMKKSQPAAVDRQPHGNINYDYPEVKSKGSQSRSFRMLQQLIDDEEGMMDDDL